MGLDTVELVLAVEEEFAISIPDEQAAKLETVGQMHQWICGELTRLERPNRDQTAVFYELRRVICEQFAASPDRVTPEARFVADLGLD